MQVESTTFLFGGRAALVESTRPLTVAHVEVLGEENFIPAPGTESQKDRTIGIATSRKEGWNRP